MKILISFLLSIYSLNVMACPNITGSFEDEDGEIIKIDQQSCQKLHWRDETNDVELFADQVEREIERDGKNVVYGKASFTKDDFVLELRVVFAGTPPEGYPTHFVTSYRIDKHNNLEEKIESIQGTSYVTMKRVSFRHYSR